MFCPEDGTHLQYEMDHDKGGTVHYGPCPKCDMVWVHDGEQGVYLPLTPGEEAALMMEGRRRRQLGEYALVHHMLDTLKDEARSEGTSTYLLSIAGGGVTHKLEVRKQMGCDFTYIEYEGDHWLPITQDRALQVLAERRHRD